MEVSLNERSDQSSNSSSTSSSLNSLNECNTNQSIVFPQCIVNGSAVSQTFQILYKNEEVILNDCVSFKANLIVDANECVKQVRKTNFVLDVELWFTDQEFGPDQHNSIECVSSRQLQLHIDISRGLHYYLPVMFDYFHLSALTLSIHGSLITLCQPYLNRANLKTDKKFGNSVHATPINNCTYGYDSLLFASSSNIKTNEDVIGLRFRRAQIIHWQLSSILLAAIQSLKRKIEEYYQILPPWQQVKCLNNSVNPSTDNLSKLAQECYKSVLLNESNYSNNFISLQNDIFNINDITKPEDFITTVESDMAYLCGLAIVQWQQFLKVVLGSDRINQHLSKVHHMQRIKRFSEAFFCIEKPKRNLHSICDNSKTIFSEISESIRKSPYLTLLPPCDVECVALDGDSTTLPIIYEEKFDSEVPYDPTSASINDICFEETFETMLQNNEPSSTMKRNMRDKILNNLSRLNFGSYGKLKEEYSPTAVRASTTSLSRTTSNTTNSPSIKTSTTTNFSENKESVTLVGYRSFENSITDQNIRSVEVSNTPLSDLSLSSSYSLHNIQSQIGKRMVSSESLPDLSTNEVLLHLKKQLSSSASKAVTIKNRKFITGINEKSSNCTVKPPQQFRDNNNVDKKVREEFRGTMYFPKPPKQFTIDESEEHEEEINGTVINGTKYPINKLLAINSTLEHKTIVNDSNIADCKLTMLELLKSNKCLVCGHLNCQCGEDNDDLPALRRVSAIGSDLVSFVKAKEDFRQQIASKSKGWLIYSDFPNLASRIPYFQCDADFRAFRYLFLSLIILLNTSIKTFFNTDFNLLINNQF